MQHHRCARCRNPIRGLGVEGPGPGPDGNETWFHVDCWELARSSAQEVYEKQVRDSGLDALIAPYVTLAFVGPAAVAGGPTPTL